MKDKNKLFDEKIASLPKGDQDMVKMFQDILLSILGQPLETYADYCLRIRREHQYVDDKVYIETRRLVLRRFLARDKLFHTDCINKEYEEQSRTNIEWEI